MAALVLKFFDGFFERRLQLAYLAKQKLWEAEQYGCVYSTLAKIVDYLLYVGGQVLVLRRNYNQIALSVYAEITRPPIVDAVCLGRLLNN